MSAFAAHMRTGTTTVCRAWILTRRDGMVLGFTDHDLPLTIEGVTCAASSGLTAGALQSATGLSVDNVEARGALSHAAISEDDLRLGRWDDAAVRTFLVNWSDPRQFEVLFQGTFGEITFGDGRFSVELRGLSEALNKVRGRVYQSSCDAGLGDARCRVDINDPRMSAEIQLDKIIDGQTIETAYALNFEPGWFERGRVIVLDGPARGLVERIKRDRVAGGLRLLTLWTKLREPLPTGSRIRIEAGCDKQHATCRSKFSNLLNYRGFPHIPGDDWMMSYPTGRSANDGGRL